MADGTLPAGALQPLAREDVARRHLAVVGGGLIGLATAVAAARMGGDAVQVELYEQVSVGHEGGASIDVTRVFLRIYGAQTHYTRWTIEALGLWHDLEAQSGRRLYQPTGGVGWRMPRRRPPRGTLPGAPVQPRRRFAVTGDQLQDAARRRVEQRDPEQLRVAPPLRSSAIRPSPRRCTTARRASCMPATLCSPCATWP